MYVLGARGSRPAHGEAYREFGGATSCYVLKRGAHAVVIDCGTGLYNAGSLLADCEKLDVLLTHVHYDHILGLMNTTVFPKTARLTFYGTFSQWLGEDTLRRFLSPPFWPYTPEMGELVDVAPKCICNTEQYLTFRFWPSNHPNGTSIIRVGTDEGAICVACDYEHGGDFPDDMAKECTILFYDAGYDESEYEAHRGWGHSTWQEGVALAKRLGVPQLILTHYAPDKDDASLRRLERRAKSEYGGARYARMGDAYDLNAADERTSSYGK